MGRILLIDDDLTLGEVLPDVLAQSGHAVEVAGDGREALRLLRGPGTRPDVILLDLVMPGMDGAAFRREQLRDAALCGITTLVITAAAGGDAAARDLGAAGFLPKPLDVHLLLRKLGDHAAA